MMDDKIRRGAQDRRRINIGEDYELRYWSQKFNITPARLKDIVAKVGDSVSTIEAELRK